MSTSTSISMSISKGNRGYTSRMPMLGRARMEERGRGSLASNGVDSRMRCRGCIYPKLLASEALVRPVADGSLTVNTVNYGQIETVVQFVIVSGVNESTARSLSSNTLHIMTVFVEKTLGRWRVRLDMVESKRSYSFSHSLNALYRLIRQHKTSCNADSYSTRLTSHGPHSSHPQINAMQYSRHNKEKER